VTTEPQVIVIGGPNGAGKSTAASMLVPEGMAFVNADEIAKALPGYPSRATDIEAGRRVLGQLDELERARSCFAVESTLAGRSLATRLGRSKRYGYYYRLIFLWSPTVEFSIRRVANRVRLGGHDIPEDTIRRRYAAGIANFFRVYQPIADAWTAYHTTRGEPILIAEGKMDEASRIEDPDAWRRMLREGRDV
jgi:predicted ABC-type ATPase